ncbi:hypothetical protein GP486_006872, partial [Trichoglossum hirsutum]
NGSDIKSCFDTEDEKSDPNTNLTDVDTDVEGDSGADISWLLDENKDHSPEYYLNQEDEFNESEYINEDYSDNSCLLLDFIKEWFFQYCKYIRKDPEWTMRDISLCVINAFFDWLLNQRRGKGGRRILRKLVKKHKLTKRKHEKTAMYVENLIEYLQTNLTTTKKQYTYGRHRIQLALFYQLAGFSGNRSQALLNLQYRDIVVTLLWDPNGSPHRILIEFTCEFTKQFLGVKDVNKFPLPEIIFDPSLILSPHVFLLGLIFADQAFAAPNFISARQLSGLDIRPGYQQLELLLKPSILDVPVFRKSVRTGYRYEISSYELLSYVTLLSLMKAVGDVSNALQNMMLQHANIDTFIKHYLSRWVTADVQAIVSGYKPQKDLMQAACLSRPASRPAGSRGRAADVENPVNKVELQLSGLKFSDDLDTKVQVVDEMPLMQKHLVETIMTMPGMTVEEEFCWHNAAIDAVAAYCHFQEGRAVVMLHGRPPTQAKGARPQLVAADTEKQALSAAMLLVFMETKSTICFVCLGEASLPFKKRVYSFASPGDLTKHFKQKHLSNIRRGD